MNNRVLFLVDHKHRDLPSLSLIAYHLKKFGVVSKFTALWQYQAMIKDFDPGFLILPKPTYFPDVLIPLKREGRKLIVINTEGNNQDINHKYDIKIPPDLMFFWNEPEYEKYLGSLGEYTNLIVAGFMRGDFILPDNMNNYFPKREELLKQYGLPVKNKTITIATSTQIVHIKGKKELKQRVAFGGERYWREADNMAKILDLTQDIIRFTVKNYSDINIILKPHPNENVVFWKDFFNTLESPNVRLSLGEPINHLLKVSDFHVAHNVCTTTVEAQMAGVNSVEIQTINSHLLYDKEHLDVAQNKVFEINEFDELLRHYLLSDTELNKGSNPRLDNYIKKYFHRFDGKRCYEYAVHINDFVRKQKKKKHFYGYAYESNNSLWMYIKAELKYPIKKIKAAFSKMNDSNSLDSKIDNLGRFDNRIKAGDEKFWMEKFESFVK